jgi:protein-L-isoaspartate O-methyltransferase
MLKDFEIIKQEYYNLNRSLLKQGRLPLKETSKGFWGISACDEVFELFKKLELDKYKNFLDLGSGDGRVVLIASLFVKKAVGIEADEELYNISLSIRDKLKVNNVEFINDDFLNSDFSIFDIIYLFPDKHINLELKKKLSKELNGKIIIFNSYATELPLKKEKEIMLGGNIINIFNRF